MNVLQAASIKELYPNEELYYFKTWDSEFVVRTITPAEYQLIKETVVDKYDEEDLVAQTAIVYPSQYNVLDGDAGIPKMLYDFILEKSLLSKKSRKEIVSRFNYYNELLNNDIDSHMPVIIKMAFPEFTFEEIEGWTVDRQLKNLARALFCLRIKGVPGITGYEIQDEGEELSYAERETQGWKEETQIDPVLDLYNEYKTTANIVDYPFILGSHWNNEGAVDAIQQRIQR